MDCDGHGSHVAGIVGGSGVRSDGTTFPGPYDGSVPFSSLRIGPGVAPRASLYALRVFGCSGSTGLMTQAIEWAVDPNKDGDFSDHLDVVNLSLGSDFGTATDSSARRLRQRRPGRRRGRLLGGEQRRHLLRHRQPGGLGLRALGRGLGRLRESRAGSLRVLQPAVGRRAVVGAGTASFGGTPPGGRDHRAARLRRPRRTPARRSRTGPRCSGKIALIDRGDLHLRREGQARAGRGGHRRRHRQQRRGDARTWARTGRATVTIPSVLISLSDANRLKAELSERRRRRSLPGVGHARLLLVAGAARGRASRPGRSPTSRDRALRSRRPGRESTYSSSTGFQFTGGKPGGDGLGDVDGRASPGGRDGAREEGAPGLDARRAEGGRHEHRRVRRQPLPRRPDRCRSTGRPASARGASTRPARSRRTSSRSTTSARSSSASPRSWRERRPVTATRTRPRRQQGGARP